MKLLKILWALPLTAFGILPAIAVLLTKGTLQIRQGALEVQGPLAARILGTPLIGFAAVTIGHIIIARDAGCCAAAGAHERVHVRQGERWGVLFPFAYCAAGCWQLLRGKRFYWDNPFEVAARADEGDHSMPIGR